jgi:hypothetical protein
VQPARREVCHDVIVENRREEGAAEKLREGDMGVACASGPPRPA